MNSEEKISVLKKFIHNLDKSKAKMQTNQWAVSSLSASQLDSTALPELDIVGDLVSHHQNIMKVVGNTYTSVQTVVKQLGQLQNRKHNVNNLLDSMTAIKEAKRLSYGLGNDVGEINKNLQVYLLIRKKIFYCDQYVDKIQEQLTTIQTQYREQLEKQLQKPNSQSITDIVKTIDLISELQAQKGGIKSSPETLNERLSKFYIYLLSKEVKKSDDELFNIPIVGNSTEAVYIFFDIAKDVMKSTVSLINAYKQNIMKIGGEATLHSIIVAVLGYLMEGIILEILMREKKYFDIESISLKKIGKEGVRLKDYFNEFSAIQNQIERLRIHLSGEISHEYPHFAIFNRDLTNQINSGPLIELNTSAIKYLQAYTRSQFDRMLKKSPFIVPLWQNESEFLQKTYEMWKKSDKDWIQSTEGHEYLTNSFSLFVKAIEKSFETLNILIISSMISFMNNNLIQEDSFHAFNEIFDRTLHKFPTHEPKYYTALILLINYLYLMPNALQVQLDTLQIPEQLEDYHKRLSSELKQIIVACEHKCKQLIEHFFNSITSNQWFKNELSQDYKKVIQKWKGFIEEPSFVFLQKVSSLHAKIIFNREFQIPLKLKKTVFTPQSLISLQKQVRGIISEYESSGHSFLKNFNKILIYIEILLAETEENCQSLLNSFKIEDASEKQTIKQLRKLIS